MLAMHFLWALALGLGLNRSGARKAGYALAVAGVATAVVAVLYRIERNPTLRASHPIGNPLFLAACLIPGLVITLTAGWSGAADAVLRRRYSRLAVVPVCVVALVAMGWAFLWTGARGPAIGLVFALLTGAFLALGRRGKWIIGGLGAVAVLAGVLLMLVYKDAYSATGRSASMRVRFHAWEYALDLATERIWLGHGQSGFARKGDALAIRDVLNDPEALEAPIRHAHSEPAEVLADLGVIGAVLLLFALLLTFRAAMVALPTLPSRPLRWMLIALTTSLFGLAVEELGNVGLRLPGVSEVFYTVWGLVWAMSHTGSAPILAAMERTAARRSLALGIGLVLGVSAAELARRDFAAARAEYEVHPALASSDWERALGEADYASRWQLDPVRRLGALDKQIATRLVVARHFQEQAMRRLQAAYAQTPPDETLLALARSDVEQVRYRVAEGSALASMLLAKSPRCYNAGWMQYGLRELEYNFAAATGDADAAARYAEAAANALRQELERRPHDAIIALAYVRVTGAKLSLDEMFDILARPIRWQRMGPEYQQIVGSLAATEGFTDTFVPLADQALQAAQVEAYDQWDNAMAPERLRLCAMTYVLLGQYERAEDLFGHAVTLYARLPQPAQAGLAACYSELADCRFLRDPDRPEQAVESAQAALREAPASYPGRQVVNAVRERLAAFHLAWGHEDFVREKLLTLPAGGSAPELVDAGVAARYTMLCETFLYRGIEPLPGRIRTWNDRALELDAANTDAWMVRAELAVRDGQEDRCADALSQALERGADPGAVLMLSQSALERRPGSERLREFDRDLRKRLGIPESASATQPATVPATQEGPADVGTNGA